MNQEIALNKEMLNRDDEDLLISIFNLSNPVFSIDFELGEISEMPIEIEDKVTFSINSTLFINPYFTKFGNDEKIVLLKEIIDTSYEILNRHSKIMIITNKLTAEEVNQITNSLWKKANWFFRETQVKLNNFRQSPSKEMNKYMTDFYNEFYRKQMNIGMHLVLKNMGNNDV